MVRRCNNPARSSLEWIRASRGSCELAQLNRVLHPCGVVRVGVWAGTKPSLQVGVVNRCVVVQTVASRRVVCVCALAGGLRGLLGAAVGNKRLATFGTVGWFMCWGGVANRLGRRRGVQVPSPIRACGRRR